MRIEERLLTDGDMVVAARQLECELACVKAVRDVEAGGRGFLPDGRPKILFEGHVFWRELRVRGIRPELHARGHERVLYPRWTKEHYLGADREYGRLAEAKSIARQACNGSEAAALCAASWGLFQIMGANHGACGFATVEAFVAAMERHEREHLAAFCWFLAHEGLDQALRDKDWRAFARGYNGPGYATHGYHSKLAAAYERHAADASM